MNLIPFVRKITWLPVMQTGWGNGYVAVPEEHPYFGKDYDDLEIEIHGGLTFAGSYRDWMPEQVKGMWIFGFDTCHCDDNLSRWPDEKSVMEEVMKLLIQLKSAL